MKVLLQQSFLFDFDTEEEAEDWREMIEVGTFQDLRRRAREAGEGPVVARVAEDSFLGVSLVYLPDDKDW